MSWDAIVAFLEMGGHGPYVWSAYGLTAALMLIEPWLAARRRARAKARARISQEGR